MRYAKIEDATPAATARVDPERWVEEHGDFLYRYALLRVRRPEIAEDLEFLDDELSHKFVPQGFWNHECGPLEWRPEAEVVMHRAEFWETFRNCLSKLPVRVADVFILREIEEMETEQICRDLNISPNNLRVMLHRARMALRECLEMNWLKEPLQEAG
jgi:RNA polymerase sigma factor (sigma-70 family)